MKKLVFALAALLIYSATHAQDRNSAGMDMTKKDFKNFYHTPYKKRNSGSYDNKTALLSFSYGIPNTLYSGDYFGSSFYNVTGFGFGPVMLRFEKAIRDEVGIAVYGQIAAKSWNGYYGTENAMGVGVGALGLYHLNKWLPMPKLDAYIGVGIDFHHDNISNVDYNIYSYNTPGLIVNPMGVIGARYYFSNVFGVFVELGDTGFSYANFGITWHMSQWAMQHT